MKIKKLELVNFKRFSNLTIDLSASTELPKLVLLVGSNGSGKSSIFDAFELVSGYIKDRKRSNDKTITDSLDYYIKNDLITAFKVDIETDKGHYEFDTNNVRSQRNASLGYGFYGRSSLRQVPRLTRIALGSGKKNEINAIDTDRPRFYIERDERFENDIEIITGLILNEAFNAPQKPIADIANKYVLKINDAFEKIFGNNPDTVLRLKTLIPPLNNSIADISFEKGESVIHYNLLSSGEKEVFNIFINLISRQEQYQDTIFFFDELDLHLNTALQKTLLKELTENWIPDNCQLWIASHSLGFIEYANEAPHAAIIDLDDRNFDTSISLTPEAKNDFDVFEIAVSKEFLDTIFLGRRVVFTEGTDTPFYNNLKIKNTFFFRAQNKNEAFVKSLSFDHDCLVDRDYLTDEERGQLMKDYPKLKILKYYSFENYLYHPDNLEEYYENSQKPFDKDAYKQLITDTKNDRITREDLIASVKGARDGYPFYKNESKEDFAKKRKSFIENQDEIKKMIRSDDFETFYKVLPMKDYCKMLPQRQNLRTENLIKTHWFKKHISELLK